MMDANVCGAATWADVVTQAPIRKGDRVRQYSSGALGIVEHVNGERSLLVRWAHAHRRTNILCSTERKTWHRILDAQDGDSRG